MRRDLVFQSSFSFSGTITKLGRDKKSWHVLIHQNVAGKLPTDFRLVVQATKDADFPYEPGSRVYVEDALVYQKEGELRLKIDSLEQIALINQDINSLSFSGEVVDVKEEPRAYIVTLKQNVIDVFETKIDVLILKSFKLKEPPRIGDTGFIRSALLYEKDGSPRARIKRGSQYSVLYTPEDVLKLNLGAVDATEVFI